MAHQDRPLDYLELESRSIHATELIRSPLLKEVLDNLRAKYQGIIDTADAGRLDARLSQAVTALAVLREITEDLQSASHDLDMYRHGAKMKRMTGVKRPYA